ncbi:hypothetical protein J7E96_01235 [Streptomyces sp. ISL-96]|uniref:hypothetical protein n=1 Tax=Streptomyces sp. ISL-96 TaxID=2819191 RepID=UPI001BE769DE|nr:hypothetical protein [Streptomyces sp. ISL-96]MBT2487184.1 hypothetical protein [Streptomyces sp. ISL-96]
MAHWSVGDRVMPVDEPDHPEGPVGEVVMPTALGEVIVSFPLMGSKVYAPHKLMAAPSEDISEQDQARPSA